jgi:hypothetical protein
LTTLTPASDEQTIKRVVVPFYPPITNKLQAVFKKHQIKMVRSTRGKLGELLGNPKDQLETLQKSGIYQIDCLGCSASYIGQSRRSITTRFNDHHRNRENMKSSSFVLKNIKVFFLLKILRALKCEAFLCFAQKKVLFYVRFLVPSIYFLFFLSITREI